METDLRASRRDRKEISRKSRIKRHGGSLAQIYRNAVTKRAKE